jgi:hypothetical protein
VPRFIREPLFWRNYFYRVHIIKESLGLNKKEANSETSVPIVNVEPAVNSEPINSPREVLRDRSVSVEFVSDDFLDKPIEKELGKRVFFFEIDLFLGVSPSSHPEWEAEMRKELAGEDLDKGEIVIDAEWEERMKKELEEEFS